MTFLDRLAAICGPDHVLTGADTDRWSRDWTGMYSGRPLAVVRPADTAQVAALLSLAHDTGTPVVPVSGLTGLTGGAHAPGQLMLSLDRLNRIRRIDPAGRIAVVEAGVVIARIHEAAAEHGLIFPLFFGARGSAMIGGALSTNAGGSNVLRHGNTRDLCLGLEVVLADGRVMDLMSELHKDNSGLNLRQLVIGAEGQLGVITAAVLKLKPMPRAYATALLAVPALRDALALLNRLQEETGGAVEAFEYMPRNYVDGYLQEVPGARPPFADAHDHVILVEIGATAPRDATPLPDGTIPVVAQLEQALAAMMEAGAVLDALVAQSETQRRQMWAMREAAADIHRHWLPQVESDVCLPLDRVADFIDLTLPRIRAYDPDATELTVAHLGDGNIHHVVMPGRDDPALSDRIRETVEDVVQELGGSFSAEHGIGKEKLATMRRRKDPVALEVMRAIKAALDPKGILNPGKVIPAADGQG
jgi:FAD/FMN-containing dehydrogenase